jgi:sugar-specific transcriptional regulator TrmB
METIELLEQFGLSKKEGQLYLASLKAGEQTASTLAIKTGMARSTVNFIFDELIKKGLAFKNMKNNSTYYSAADPESLQLVIEQQKARTKKMENEFQDLLPQLIAMKGNSLIPKIKYYEGFDGLCRVIDYSCDEDKSVYFISSHGNMDPHVREYIEKVYIPKSKKKKNKNKMIINDSKQARDYLKRAEGVYDDVFFVDSTSIPFRLTTAVMGDTTLFVSYSSEDMSGIIIKNPLIAEHMLSIFEALKMACDK